MIKNNSYKNMNALRKNNKNNFNFNIYNDKIIIKYLILFK